MGAVNFFLKKAEPGATKRLIYLQFRYAGGQKFVYTFKQKVELKNWNQKKQRVKSNLITTEDGQYSLNDLLDNLTRVLTKAYAEELANGIPSKGVLKKHLDSFMFKNLDDDPTKDHTLHKLIDRFIAGEIKFKGRDKSKASLLSYQGTKNHLQAFQKARGYKVDFETVTLDFFYQYTTYLKNTLKLSQNTIGKDIRLLKVFMNEAVDLGYTTNYGYKHKKFTVQTKETDNVYLTEKEVIHLYQHDLSDNPQLEGARDLFVFGCFTGLRFSDYSNVKQENIVQRDGDYYIKMFTQKTKELVIIPCNPVVLEIFRKYSGNQNNLPKSMNNQKFNGLIKEACQAAKLNEKGRLSTNPELELWQSVSSHTARRSFCTNLYLEGFPVIDLMKISGHRTEIAFLKYIKVTKLDTAKRLSEHIKKNWSAKILKVAS